VHHSLCACAVCALLFELYAQPIELFICLIRKVAPGLHRKEESTGDGNSALLVKNFDRGARSAGRPFALHLSSVPYSSSHRTLRPGQRCCSVLVSLHLILDDGTDAQDRHRGGGSSHLFHPKQSLEGVLHCQRRHSTFSSAASGCCCCTMRGHSTQPSRNPAHGGMCGSQPHVLCSASAPVMPWARRERGQTWRKRGCAGRAIIVTKSKAL